MPEPIYVIPRLNLVHSGSYTITRVALSLWAIFRSHNSACLCVNGTPFVRQPGGRLLVPGFLIGRLPERSPPVSLNGLRVLIQ